ncbi:MAG: phosphodiester glycosidase family protein [Phycisphaerales bacterium]|nr:MAG: phosphodiester glycosidase family protein [Phycisphaerales bacterium]
MVRSTPSMARRFLTVLAVGVGLVGSALASASPVRVERYESISDDGPVRGFLAWIDLSAPGVEVVVTGPAEGLVHERAKAVLTPTDAWLDEHGLTLAVNANFFAWLGDRSSPRAEADLVGLSVSDGKAISPERSFGGRADPVLFIDAEGRARVGYGTGSFEPVHAVAGIGGSPNDSTPGTLLVEAGENTGATARVQPSVRHPRTAAGVSEDGRTLMLAVIDGRRPEWSIGASLPELAEIMIGMGAHAALNLDGGGSTSFVYIDGQGERLVNRPSDGRMRAVANHLGVRVEREGNRETEESDPAASAGVGAIPERSGGPGFVGNRSVSLVCEERQS